MSVSIAINSEKNNFYIHNRWIIEVAYFFKVIRSGDWASVA